MKHWIKSKKEDITDTFVCPHCDALIILPYFSTKCFYNFCPYCGEKVDREENNENVKG